MISAIRWVSELIGIAGGDDVFPELALQSLGRDRIIGDGVETARREPRPRGRLLVRQEVPAEKVAARPGWAASAGGAQRQLHEIKSSDILQPGPAALTDGVEQLHRIILAWCRAHGSDSRRGASLAAFPLRERAGVGGARSYADRTPDDHVATTRLEHRSRPSASSPLPPSAHRAGLRAGAPRGALSASTTTPTVQPPCGPPARRRAGRREHRSIVAVRPDLVLTADPTRAWSACRRWA